MIDQQPPAVYLRGEPTPEEATLAQLCGLHAGSQVPFWMFARVAERTHSVSIWAGTRRAIERKLRRWLIAGAAFAATNLGGAIIFVMHRAEDNGAAREHVAQLERGIERYRQEAEARISELREDVRDLRRELRKVTGADAVIPGDSAEPFTRSLIPDKYSSISTLGQRGLTCAMIPK